MRYKQLCYMNMKYVYPHFYRRPLQFINENDVLRDTRSKFMDLVEYFLNDLDAESDRFSPIHVRVFGPTRRTVIRQVQPI